MNGRLRSRGPRPAAVGLIWLLIAAGALLLGAGGALPHGHADHAVGLYDEDCPLASLDSTPRDTIAAEPPATGRPRGIGGADPISAVPRPALPPRPRLPLARRS
jgi:hypothetical protein